MPDCGRTTAKGDIIQKFHIWRSRARRQLSRTAYFLKIQAKQLRAELGRRAPNLKKLHLQSFPAIHLKKMDWLDFVLKFSAELFVVILAILVAALNVFFFSGQSYQDQSLAGNFIGLHRQLNQKVYAQNSSIVTTVSQDSFVPQAYANETFNADDNPASDPSNPGTGAVMDDSGGITAPSPDSIQVMVAQQVKNYLTRPGDTLQSIAGQFGVSINTIKWSNPNLTGNNIEPGWNLLIPPTDGVVVVANDNTTLPDLAAQYNPERYNPNAGVRDAAASALLAKIISYNGLDSAEDITGGQIVIIPGGVVAAPPPPPPAPKPKPKSGGGSSYDNGINTVTSVSGGYDAENHLFPKGYCTYYVATRMKITFGGNAKNWLANARASGYVTGGQPAPRSAVVMTGPYGVMRRDGHVAYVESVNGDGTITVSEMNYYHFNRVDTRTISIHDPSIKGYIYP